MPHARPGKEWLHLRDAICMGDTKAVVDVLVGEGIPDLTYDEMDEMLIGLKHGGTDACAVVTEQEFKFAINNMIAQATAVDPMASFVTERWDRVFNDMVGRASGRIPSAPSAHEPGHQQTWQEALMDARRWAYANPQIADSGYAISYIDSLLDGTVERRAAEYAAMGIPGTDRASAIRAQMLYVLNNLASWRGEEARTAKATLRAVSKGDLPAHFTAAEEYVRRQTELQERDIHAATHHDHGEGQFDVYHPGVGPGHYTDETPEGALEAMERRLMEALANMGLQVGELANAVQQMGLSDAEIVDLVDAVETATEAITDVTFGVTAQPVEEVAAPPRRPGPPPRTTRLPWREETTRGAAITSYMIEQGGDLGTMTTEDVVAAVQEKWPNATGQHVSSAWNNAAKRGLKLPRLTRLPLGRRPGTGTPEPVVEAAPVAPVGVPRTIEELPLDEQTIVVYMEGLGDALGDTTYEDILDALHYQWPDMTLQQVQNAWNSLRWINFAQGKPRPPMPRGAGGGLVEEVEVEAETPPPPVVTRARRTRGQGRVTPQEEARRAEVGHPFPIGSKYEAIYNYAMGLENPDDYNEQDVIEALQERFPDIKVQDIRYARGRAEPYTPMPLIRPVGRWPSAPPAPTQEPGIVESRDVGPVSDLEQGFRDLFRPERIRRNGGSWSRKYYPGLTEAQHDVNDAWFEAMLEMLNPNGILGVPNIQKAFNKQGEEVPFPPQPGNPPNRVTQDPPASVKTAWF